MSQQAQAVVQTQQRSVESELFSGKSGLQRSAVNSTFVQGTLSPTGQPLNPQRRTFTESRFSYDFSSVLVRSVTPTVTPISQAVSLEEQYQPETACNSAEPVSA